MSKTQQSVDLEPPIKVLRAKARDNLPDDIVNEYDEIDDDGNKLEVETYSGPTGKDQEIKHNLTAMYWPGASTTGDVDMLVLEAEMRAGDEYELSNPHIPATVEARNEALDRMQSEGLSPAWEQ